VRRSHLVQNFDLLDVFYPKVSVSAGVQSGIELLIFQEYTSYGKRKIVAEQFYTKDIVGSNCSSSAVIIFFLFFSWLSFSDSLSSASIGIYFNFKFDQIDVSQKLSKSCELPIKQLPIPVTIS